MRTGAQRQPFQRRMGISVEGRTFFVRIYSAGLLWGLSLRMVNLLRQNATAHFWFWLNFLLCKSITLGVSRKAWLKKCQIRNKKRRRDCAFAGKTVDLSQVKCGEKAPRWLTPFALRINEPGMKIQSSVADAAAEVVPPGAWPMWAEYILKIEGLQFHEVALRCLMHPVQGSARLFCDSFQPHSDNFQAV